MDSMYAADANPSSTDKEILRQREIDTQLNAMLSPVPSTRAAAARRLGDLQAGLGALLDALNDPAESVRAAAAMALGNFQNSQRLPEIVDFLLAAIDDPSTRVCQTAIRSLGMLRAAEARADIETFLEDTNPYILGSAILALARLGASDLAPRLAGYLSHESNYVKMQAARAVAVLKYMPAGPEIVHLLEKTRAARMAEGFSDPVARRQRGVDELYSLQNQLIRAAGELKQEAAVPLLLEIARKDIGFRGLAIEALVAIGADIDLPVLSGLLTDPSIYLRKRLIQLIAQHNYRPALPLLRQLLQEENVTIRVAALQAISEMRDTGSLPHIEWICHHDSNPFLRVQALQALAAMNDQPAERREDAIAHLLALADDANFQVRRSAVCQLLEWNITDNRALPVLARFAIDFPTDAITSQIITRLEALGVDPAQAAAHRPSPLPAPAELAPDPAQLLSGLEAWQAALGQHPSGEHQEVRAALALLIATLRRAAD